MTQEDKDLLHKDLCARLPYGVKVRYSSYEEFITCTLHSINPIYNIVDLWSKDACFNSVSISKIKPYLFSLSNMTDEQKVIYGGLCYSVVRSLAWDTQAALNELVDWLNKNHFDYRGLIEKGLAIDCTNLNIY